MTPLPSPPPETAVTRPAPGTPPIRLCLRIPQTAIPKALTLPRVAEPWQQHLDENDTWVYTFPLIDLAELDAALLLVYAPGLKWERIMVLGWGVPVFHNYVREVLTCLRKSYAHTDYRAHCWTGRRAVPMEQEADSVVYKPGQPRQVCNANQDPVLDPARAPIFLSPCRYASHWQPLTTIHPAGIRAQIEAGLVEKGCRWCPRLDHLDDWAAQMWGTPPDTSTHSAPSPTPESPQSLASPE